MWGAKAEVQIFRRKFHTHIHLDYVRIEFLSCIKIIIIIIIMENFLKKLVAMELIG